MDVLQRILGDPVADPEEEAFLIFSQTIPSQSLGFVDSKASTIDITVAGHDLTIHQSRGLLTSDRKQGTTGAVVWKITPLFAEWITLPNFLSQAGYLSSDTVAIELGAGVSGVVALTLGRKLKRYIATDQDYVIRLLKQNISENLPPSSAPAPKKPSSKRLKTAVPTPISHIDVLELDWETDSVASLTSVLGQDEDGLDVVVACDCIYNDALIEPLNTTCAQICRLRSKERRPTICLIAQQLRSAEVFESWLKSFYRHFHVWRVPDEFLTAPLRENTGFVIHIGILR